LQLVELIRIYKAGRQAGRPLDRETGCFSSTASGRLSCTTIENGFISVDLHSFNLLKHGYRRANQINSHLACSHAWIVKHRVKNIRQFTVSK
jgi:hypothetical protein